METKSIIIGKYSIEYKSFATARDINVIRSQSETITDTQTVSAEEAIIKQLVTKITYKKDEVDTNITENILDFILDNLEFTTEYVPLVTELSTVISKKK